MDIAPQGVLGLHKSRASANITQYLNHKKHTQSFPVRQTQISNISFFFCISCLFYQHQYTFYVVHMSFVCKFCYEDMYKRIERRFILLIVLVLTSSLPSSRFARPHSSPLHSCPPCRLATPLPCLPPSLRHCFSPSALHFYLPWLLLAPSALVLSSVLVLAFNQFSSSHAGLQLLLPPGPVTPFQDSFVLALRVPACVLASCGSTVPRFMLSSLRFPSHSPCLSLANTPALLVFSLILSFLFSPPSLLAPSAQIWRPPQVSFQFKEN